MVFKYYPDKKVVKGIFNGDVKVYKYLDGRFRKTIIKYVKNNGSLNPREDGNDLYQNTMLEIIKVVRDGRYRENWKFKKFFERVYKTRWYRMVNAKKEEYNIAEGLQIPVENDVTHDELEFIYESIKDFDIELQDIFKLEKMGYTLREIAEEWGESYARIRKKKSRGIIELRKMITERNENS